jgi:hypothetical protein
VFLPSGYKVLWCIRASRYRVVKELVNYPGAVKFIMGSGAIRVFQAYYPVLVAGAKAKSVTNNLPILSVLCLGPFLIIRKLSIKGRSFRKFDLMKLQSYFTFTIILRASSSPSFGIKAW